ncbi:MAG: hypothetical protein AMJ84_00035 [Acidithiobacillales bacterium SM23_46]|nr:MAG: hypothetical protein AMJ84_00035 [Acidithiobacillales bacterium SM23_46]KPL28992.1 MAG: hypothetical protein AMJ72_00080 [Acidithiobacillales bacterium SM1_46]
MKPTHVSISKGKGEPATTWRLGNPLPGQQIQCIGDDGLVHRVCHWQSWFEVGTVVFTSGERHHFHGPGQAKHRRANQ